MSLILTSNRQRKANLAIDMVKAALNHYARFERPVQDIVLSQRLWNQFVKGMIEKDPEKEYDLLMTDEIVFKNCTVKKGSTFMLKSMYVTLKQRVLE